MRTTNTSDKHSYTSDKPLDWRIFTLSTYLQGQVLQTCEMLHTDQHRYLDEYGRLIE